MKKFLHSVFKFFFLNMTILIVMLAAAYFILSKASFAVPKDRNILIIGDSHTECAIDDSIFIRSFNISQSGTAYLYSYLMLRIVDIRDGKNTIRAWVGTYLIYIVITCW